VADAVTALLDDPAPLVQALARRPDALIHGDLWPVNVALTDAQVVLLDWGLAGWAPPALDVTAFLAGAGAANIAVSREDVLDEYRELCGPDHDEDGLRLALLNGLVDFGWNKALDALTALDPAERERHRSDLNWWVQQARHTLRGGALGETGPAGRAADRGPGPTAAVPADHRRHTGPQVA
jgi:thiamine kinase-like enzyme